MKKLITASLIPLLGLISTFALGEIQINLYKTVEEGQGEFIGTVTARNSPEGLSLEPDLKDLPPGLHGFHVHEIASCDDFGRAAGGHYDPKETSQHLGPYNNAGHLGDLPPLYVDEKGEANIGILAPRLTERNLLNHSLIIHEGGDNFADFPKPLGGGGDRIACGVISQP